MTEEARLEMYPCVLRAAARASIVVRSAPGIDRRGLHVTNCEALGDALARLEPGPEAICLVDGFRLPRCEVPHRRVVGGDRTSAAIAAASVLAKVTRDRYMVEAAERHPGWGFEEHVGYSTPEHRAAIEEIGISPLHRLSFASVAYSQLELGLSKQIKDAGSVACDSTRATEELAPRARTAPSGRSMRRSDEFELEGTDEVLEIDDYVVAVEGDADGVEADLGVARR